MEGPPQPRRHIRWAFAFVVLPVAAFVGVFVVTLALSDDGAAPSPAPTRAATTTGIPSADVEAGRLILTLFGEGAEPVAGYLTSVAFDGSDPRPITDPPAEDVVASDVAPALSPDGQTIAFQRAVSGPSRGTPPFVYLVGRDGSGLRRLTTGRSVELDPAWSPDGSRIALARRDRGTFELFVSASDGSGLERLTSTKPADEDYPAWSPDGSRIAFTRYETGFETSGGDLWTMRPDGTGSDLLLGGRQDDSSPAWSPDGSRIAFVRDGHIAVVSADGSGVQILTSGSEEKEFRPRWLPDGNRIVFTRDPGLILIVSVGDRRLSQIELDVWADGAIWDSGT